MGRRKRYSRGFDDVWPAYVPVAQRREQARRGVAKLRKQGEDIQPIEIEGRTIARSFWGKGWCKHLESFGDYSNRLPRGRSYVRNGSVCHLGIEQGEVDAIVSGSELYRVRIEISPLPKKKWQKLKQQCTGKIGSLIELLQGNLSDAIMQTVTDPQHGLFPLHGEISYTCNCPDSATMCKHISAVMYGIGARLDARPELLFLLRGVDHDELISADAAADTLVGQGSRRARRRSLTDGDLENVFGVELDAPQPGGKDAPQADTARSGRGRAGSAKQRPAKRKTGKKKAASKKAPSRRKLTKAGGQIKPTARSIARLRRQLGWSKTEFAKAVGVSPATVANWEKAQGPIKPHAKSLAGLNKLYARAKAPQARKRS